MNFKIQSKSELIVKISKRQFNLIYIYFRQGMKEIQWYNSDQPTEEKGIIVTIHEKFAPKRTIKEIRQYIEDLEEEMNDTIAWKYF